MTAYERRSFAGAAVETTLGADISGTGAATVTISDATGWPDTSGGPFFFDVDYDGSKPEQMQCTARTGTSLTVPEAGRGLHGTSAATHAAGVKARFIATKTDLDEANYWASELAAAVDAAGDIPYGDGDNSLGTLNVDDSTLEIGSDTLKVKNAGITATQIAAAVAGDGLAGGAGTALSVTVDDSTIEIATDTLQVKADGIDSAHIAAGAIDLEHMSANSVDSDQYVDGSIDNAHLAANSVDSDQYVDASIDPAHLASDTKALFVQQTDAGAKGDLLVGSADDDWNRKAAGADYTVVQWLAAADDGVQAGPATLTWTPTLVQGTATDIAKTVNKANYWRIGPLVFFEVVVTPSAAGDDNNAITVSLPVTAAVFSAECGVGSYADTGTAEYRAAAFLQSATTLALRRADVTASTAIGESPNIAVASTDVFRACGFYLAAS